MKVLVVRGTAAYRTDERISKLVRRAWGRRAHWWTQQYDEFTLVFDRPITIKRDLGWDAVEPALDNAGKPV